MKLYLSICSFVYGVFWVIAKNFLPDPILAQFSPIFFFKSFIVLALIFSKWPLLVNFFLCCDVRIQISPFARRYPIVQELSVKTLLSSLNCFGIFVKIQLTINVRNFWTLNSVLLSILLTITLSRLLQFYTIFYFLNFIY